MVNIQKALIVLTVAIGIAAVAATILIGARTFEGTVVKNPYETGLQWDAAQRARKNSGWIVAVIPRTVPTGSVPLQIRITQTQGVPIGDAAVIVDITRPETDAYDRRYPAMQGPQDDYHVIVDLDRPGRWDLHILVSRGNRSAEFEDTLRAFVPGASTD